MWNNFKIRVPGKWVLTGEHAVLRGATAVALPHPEMGLTLSFESRPGGSQLEIEPSDAETVILDLLNAVAESWTREGRQFTMPTGRLEMKSTIPIGAGLGSSAALCVALTHWLSEPLGLSPEQKVEYATQLEHRFHGRSSGMDVAVIAAGEPISFVMGKGSQCMGIRKLPRFTFHDTGLRSRTSECVSKVETFRGEKPSLAEKVDEVMSSASRSAMEGLARYEAGNVEEGLKILQESMEKARECFYTWELVPGAAKRLEEDLLKQGARAVKITGAGGGGMVVALWE